MCGQVSMAKKGEKEDDAPEGEEAAAGGGKKKLIIMVAAAVLVLGGGGGGYMFFAKKKAAAAAEAEKQAVKVEPVKPSVFVDLPDMTINVSSAGDRPHYLRLKVALEVSDQKAADDVKPVLPRVVDAFQVYMREMRTSDLEGSAGMYRLKDELTRRVNAAVHPSRVNAVLFKEFILQ
jgi:flagellar FliL protein